jgi:hypothetical protein
VARTTETEQDPAAFAAAVEHPVRRRDAERMLALCARATGQPARMWGPSIVGFGSYTYRYESGREGEWMVVGFSPRKNATTLYLPGDVEERAAALAAVGPHTTGRACVYLKDLDAVDLDALETLVRDCYRDATS